VLGLPPQVRPSTSATTIPLNPHVHHTVFLGPLVAVADLPGRRALRSASTSRLVAPPIKLSTVGSRVFPVDAPQVWNGLSEAVVSSSSLQTFRRQLKTHYYFQLSYPRLIFRPFDWQRYSSPCSNARYLGHSKNLFTYCCVLRPTVRNSLELSEYHDSPTGAALLENNEAAAKLTTASGGTFTSSSASVSSQSRYSTLDQ